MPNPLLEKLFSKSTADTVGATLPWIGGGALGGAALGAGSYALQDEEEKKHQSLLKSMALGAGLGGTFGGGMKALGGLVNPETLKTNSILPPEPSKMPAGQNVMALMGQHPGLTGLGTAGATAGLLHKPISSKITDMEGPLKATAEKANKALADARVSHAVSPSAATQAKMTNLEQLASKSKAGVSPLRKLLMRFGVPALAGGAAAGAVDAWGNELPKARAYDAALRQMGGPTQ